MMPALADHLWQSTFFALAAGVLTLAFRKHHGRVRYSLWLAASLKFLFPFSLLIVFGTQLGPLIMPARVRMAVSEASLPASPFTIHSANILPATGALAAVNYLPIILLSVWVAGVLCLASMSLRRWLRVRRIVLAGSRKEIGLSVPTVATVDYPEPAVFGIIHPVLLLPEGITDRLTAPELRAVLAHELCHIRYRDNLAAALHMLVEALFWFHPLVWWIGARLINERERACDEYVLATGSEPAIYAESLVKVCEYCLESRIACVAGVTGSNLKKRVEAILTGRTARKLDLSRKLLLAAAALTAVVTPVIIGLAGTPRLSAQAQPATQAQSTTASTQRFEVASIKVSKNPASGGNVEITPGRFKGTDLALQWLILVAYRIRSANLSGNLPGWTINERYSIEAKTDDASGEDRILVALQNLLKDRFQLKEHREMKEEPVYFLTIAKGGIKMPDGSCVPVKKDLPNECYSVRSEGPVQTLDWRGVSMSDPSGVAYRSLTAQLSGSLRRTIIDKTGLTGTFDVHLRWAKDPEPSAAGASSLPAEPGAPSLPDALEEQLGLKLESGRGPVEHLVVDHVEKPDEN